MIAPLLVGVAHGLDLLTFLFAVTYIGIEGETNGWAHLAYAAAGLPGVALLKAAGTVGLAYIAYLRRWALVPATLSGIVGATVNTTAIYIVTR